MKKIAFLVFLSAFILTGYNLYAEETQTAATEPVAQPAEIPVEAAPVAAETPVETPPVEVVTPVAAEPEAPAQVTPATEETINTENLEFISGEVTAMDDTAKTVTVKLYGETENDTNQKILTVKVDETTDITDGEKDRDAKSLTAGTEVDVEYDPASNKATYIFVY